MYFAPDVKLFAALDEIFIAARILTMMKISGTIYINVSSTTYSRGSS